jgi:hypothetical protein
MNKFSDLQCAVISCNVSYSNKIDESTLMAILKGEQPITHWLPHVGTFFNEVPEKCIKGVSQECNIPMEQLERIFYSLPEVYQDSHFPKICHG